MTAVRSSKSRPATARTVGAVAVALAMSWLVACAHAEPGVLAQPRCNLTAVSIVDRTTGQTLPTYRSQGQYWIAGEPGHAYSISIRNLTGARTLSVVSVDGVNVVSGETAWRDKLANQTGYVLGAHDGMDIRGWRKSQGEVATFEFSVPSQSYAAQTGRGAEVGAIGVAVFRELPPPPPAPLPDVVAPQRDGPSSWNTPDRRIDPLRERADSAPPPPPSSSPVPAPAAPLARSKSAASGAFDAAATAKPMDKSANRIASEPGLGTAHGARQASWISYTNFERLSTTPDEIVVIRYDRRETLMARGIIPGVAPRLPDPFPVAGFVPDPPTR